MDFEWDGLKRQMVLAKHHLDFIDASLVFEGPIRQAEARGVNGEKRLLAIGSMA